MEKSGSELHRANEQGCDKIKYRIDSLLTNSEKILNEISIISLNPTDKVYVQLENNIFNIAPLIPICSHYFPAYIEFYSNLRKVIKEQSRNWEMNSTEAKNTLYRLLYGNRTAIEEIMLQLPDNLVDPLIKGTEEPSITTSVKIMGVDVHSGDILVSRGGAPTSALIARGNDYPGNFSHVALVHVNDKIKTVSIIESHIEIGVKFLLWKNILPTQN